MSQETISDLQGSFLDR